MSWFSPKNIPETNYNPDDRVEAFVMKAGLIGAIVLEAFNNIDPLHVIYGDNSDEYLGYAERFMNQLGTKKLKDLTDDEILTLVRGSFHPNQIGKFVSEEDIQILINNIKEIKVSFPDR